MGEGRGKKLGGWFPQKEPSSFIYAGSGKTTAHDGQTGGTVFMWSYDSVFYQISTLGFCGAPTENDGVLAHTEVG